MIEEPHIRPIRSEDPHHQTADRTALAGAEEGTVHEEKTPSHAEERLIGKNIRPTANRILLLRALEEAGRPVSLADLESLTETIDKSGISRALALFQEQDLIHSFEDGRGVRNYELCTEEGDCDHEDAHIHFYCERCHRSFCMEHIDPQSIVLPAGFRAHSFSFVVKGVCPDCR